jgi:hypothetical protein
VKLLTEKFSIFILSFLLLFSCGALPCFSLEEEITDKYPAAVQPSAEKRDAEYYKPPEEPLEVNISVDLQQGYDNNVDLDSERHKDGFLQAVANAEVVIKPQLETLKLVSGADLFGIVYYKYNVNNIFDMAPYAGFDWEILPGLTWQNRATFDYLSYPNSKENTFGGLEFSTYADHFITEDLYHRLGYEYIRRWYSDRKASRSDSTQGSDDREDSRHKVKYTLGMYFTNFLVKLSNELYHNDSNDMYQDYYDYWVYRVRPSIMYFFTDNIYANASLTFKYIPYDDRRSTEDSGKRVRDYTYIGSTSVYYDFTKDVTFGMTYSYTENASNDPFQKYSGSIFSGGVYYSF